MMASQITSVETEIVPGPPIHDLVLPQEASYSQDTSDYETASTVSSTSIEANAKVVKQRTCCGITYNRFKSAIKIKPRYIPTKLAYYFFYAARSTLATYFIIFLTSTGLNPEQVGFIQGIRMLVFTFGGMFWGLLADKSNKRLPIMLVQTATFAGLLFLKPWMAHWINSGETPEDHRQHVISAVQAIIEESGTNTSVKSIISHRTSKQISKLFGLEWSNHHYNTGSTPLFASMLIIGIFSAFFGGGIQIMLDAKVMEFTTNTSKNKSTYGRQRLWGSVAYSLTPVICGAILEAAPNNSISPYMPVFYIHLGLMCMSLMSFTILFKQHAPNSNTNNNNDTTIQEESSQPLAEVEEQSVLKFIFQSIKNPHMGIFLLNVLCTGYGNSLQWSFQFIYMEEMNASKTLMGFCAMTQCGAEAIFFPMASKIIQKIGGNKPAIAIGITGYGIIFVLLSVIRNPVLFPLVTCIVGFTYTLFHIAANDTMYKASTPRCMTTLYALYNGILVGVGGALSGVLGGIIYKNIGGEALYMTHGIIFLVLGAANVVYAICYKRSPETIARPYERTYKQFMDVYMEPNPPNDTETPHTIDEAISIDEGNIV